MFVIVLVANIYSDSMLAAIDLGNRPRHAWLMPFDRCRGRQSLFPPRMTRLITTHLSQPGVAPTNIYRTWDRTSRLETQRRSLPVQPATIPSFHVSAPRNVSATTGIMCNCAYQLEVPNSGMSGRGGGPGLKLPRQQYTCRGIFFSAVCMDVRI